MKYDKVSRKAEYILNKLKYLSNNKPKSIELFISDETAQMAILYALHVCIEAIVDMVILIGTKKFEKEYEGDYEMFEALFNEGIINEHVFETLRKLNGLRNSIVHAYDSLLIDEIWYSYEKILRDIGHTADNLLKLV